MTPMTFLNLFYKSNGSPILNIGIFILIGWLTDCSSANQTGTDYSATRSLKTANDGLVCYKCVYDEALPVGDANRNDGCITPVGDPGPGSKNCIDVLFGVWECVKKTTVVTNRNGTQVKKLERIPCHDDYYGPGDLHLDSDDIKEKKCHTVTKEDKDSLTVVTACVCNTANLCNSDEGIDTIDPNATNPRTGGRMISEIPDNITTTVTSDAGTGTVSRTTTVFIMYYMYSLIFTKLFHN